jgi:hypothetical protein
MLGRLAFQKRTRGRTKLAVVGCVSLLTAVGCSRPKQYRLGEAISTAVLERVGHPSRSRNGRSSSVLAGRFGLD